MPVLFYVSLITIACVIIGLSAYLQRRFYVRLLSHATSLHHTNQTETDHATQAMVDQQQRLIDAFTKQLANSRDAIQKTYHDLSQTLSQQLADMRLQLQTGANENHVSHLKTLQSSIGQGMKDTREHIHLTLHQHSTQMNHQVDKLTQETKERLNNISQQVERRLTDGFEKTTATFTDIVKRLALIDQAQKQITELSANVVNLQQVLSNKSTRGLFGEIQLAALIRNVLPESHFALQHTLSNGTRVDCLLLLPEPTGRVAIDAKFPLEDYRQMTNLDLTTTVREQASRQFKQAIKRHIHDIANKYIIANETADGAMMFIPAEAVFAEIHAHHPDLVEFAQQSRVWLVSPTTMMAILTTARAVLKDADTRKQVHIIQKHLVALSKDFDRFQRRMQNLSRHIGQAHADVEEVNTSAGKITKQFHKIEQVELGHDANETLTE